METAAQARRETGQLARPRADCETRLAAAEQGGVATDLPAFADVRRGRESLTQAEGGLADRQADLTSAREELDRQTAAHTAAIAAAQAEERSAADAASNAADEFRAAQGRLEAIESQIRQTQTQLEKLASAESGESTEALNSRLAAFREQHAGVETRLAAARQAERQSASAAEAKAGELRKAGKAWLSEQARLQKAVASAEALTTPDKDAAAQSARAASAEATRQHEQTASALETESKRLAEVAKADQAKVQGVSQELADVHRQVQATRDILTARELRPRLADLEAKRSAATAEVAAAQTQADQTRQQADAKAEQLRQARQAWAETKGRCEAAVASAASAQEESENSVQSARAALAVATRAFGRQAHERGEKSGPLEGPAAKATACVEELARIDARAVELRSRMDAARGPARKTALLSGGGLLLIAAIVVGVVWIVHASRSGPSTSAPALQASAGQAGTTGTSTTKSEQRGPGVPPANGQGPGQDARTTAQGTTSPPRTDRLAPEESEKLCRQRLARLAAAIKTYKRIHNGNAPAKLSDLYYGDLVGSVSDFACPASETPVRSRAEIDDRGDFTLAPLPGAPDLLVREKTPRHTANAVLSVLPDGTIHAIPFSPPSTQP